MMARCLLGEWASMKKPELYILAIAALAAIAKLYCAWTTVGTMDVICFRGYGNFISDHDLIAMYRRTPVCNHTRLVVTVARLLYDLTAVRGGVFCFFLRLPAMS